MDLETAIKQRLARRAQQRELDQILADLEHQAQSKRETQAILAISDWLDKTYNVSIAPNLIHVQESRYMDVQYGVYHLEIVFSYDQYIRSNRDITSNGIWARPEPHVGDLPETGGFGNMWHAVHNQHYCEFSDFIDAVIYALGKDEPEPIPDEF